MASVFGGSLRLALKQSLAETGHLVSKRGAKGEKRRRGRPPKAVKKKISKKLLKSSSYCESLLSSSSSSLSSVDDVGDNGSYCLPEPVVKNDEYSSYDVSSSSTEERELEDDFPDDAMSNNQKTDRVSEKLLDKHKKHLNGSIKQHLRLKAGKKRKRDDQSLFSSSVASSKKSTSKKSSKARTVTPPSEELLAWTQSRPASELRRNISVGHRVKVRFDLKSNKKDGTRRYRWYGGRVVEVLKGGKRIRIVYDDGTKEVSTFPDYDVIVDDENNGSHHVSSTSFFTLSEQSSGEEQVKVPVPTKKMPQKEIDLDDRFEEVSLNMDSISRPPLSDINSEHLSSPPSNKASTVTESSFSMPNSSSSSNHDSSESSCSESSLGYDSTLKQSNQNSEPPRISISCTPKEPVDIVTRNVPSLTIKLIPPKKAKPSVVDERSFCKDSQSNSDVKPNSVLEQEPISNFYKSKERKKSKKLKKLNALSEDKKFDAPTEISCHMPFSMKEAKVNRKQDMDSNAEKAKGVTKFEDDGKLNSEENAMWGSNESNQSSFKTEQGKGSPKSNLRESGCEDSIHPKMDALLLGDSSSNQSQTVASTNTNLSEECTMVKLCAHDTNPNSDESTQINVDLKSQSSRSGRRAALKAIERIAAKEIVLVDEYVVPKKKREKVDLKLFPSFSAGNQSSSNSMQTDVEEEPWVQCDRCLKWRLLPSTVKMDELPERWYCELNVHDSERNDCDAPEQTSEEIATCKTSPSKVKSDETDSAQNFDKSIQLAEAGDNEIDATKVTSILTKEEHLTPPNLSNSCTDARLSPTPSLDSILSENRRLKCAENKKENRISIKIPPLKLLESNSRQLVPESDQSSASHADIIRENASMREVEGSNIVLEPADAALESSEAVCSNKRIKLGKSKRIGKETGKENKVCEGEDKDLADNQEWVQCDKCKKWRMLPLRISAEDLPDIWYCTMNTWDVAKASCDAEEVKLESKVKDCTMVNERPTFIESSVSGKMSYRYLVFGTGKKLGRPTSERARAADSLFATCPTEQTSEGSIYSRFMYSTSSAFKPKLFNAHKKSFEDRAESENFLNFMSKSNLWSELDSCFNNYQPSLLSDFDYSLDLRFKLKVPLEKKLSAKDTLQDIIVSILGSSSLAVHEIYLNCISELSGNVQNECSLDHVVFSIEELLKEGVVEISK